MKECKLARTKTTDEKALKAGGSLFHGSLKSEKPSSYRNVDDLLKNIVHPFGWWQFIVTMLAVWSDIPAAIFPIYANSVPKFRCMMEPNIENLLLSASFYRPNNIVGLLQPKGPSLMLGHQYVHSFEDIASAIGPWIPATESTESDNTEELPGCFRFQRNWSSITSARDIFKLSNETSTEPCPHGYVYETNEYQYPSGIVIEWNLVCENEWLAPLSTSLYMLGMVPGFWIGGWCADAVGRRITALVFLGVQMACGLVSTFAPNFAVYAAFRFLLGMSTVARSNVLLILPVELTLARYRFIVTSSTCIVQSFINRAMTALVAYFVPYWRWLHLATLAPLLIGLLQIWYLPESPRWLLGRERKREAALVLYHGYIQNQKGFRFWQSAPITEANLEDFERYLDVSTEESTRVKSQSLCSFKSLWDGLRRPYTSKRLARISLIATFLFTAQTACLFGVLLYARIIRSYVYLVAFINNLTGIPGAFLSSILYAKCRHRKRPLMIVYLCAFLCLGSGGLYAWMTPFGSDIFLTVCSNLGLILSTAITNMLLSYIPELYPSCIRSQGLGNAAGLGRIGAAMGTFINQLDTVLAHGVPLVFYAGLLLLAFVALIFLPDTTGENLPDKCDETEEDKEDEGEWDNKDEKKTKQPKEKENKIKSDNKSRFF